MKRLKRYLIMTATIAIAIVGIRFTQEIGDWSKLLTYEPPPEIAKLATSATMTDAARRLFYLNQPTIETTKSSLNLCKGSEHTIVLGCYVTSKGIFLQAVTDPRLQGVMEVTAAHEMLHAAYQRMSMFEQTKISKQLRVVLKTLTNARIIKLVATYESQDPRSVDSELHSILGTEVRNLSPELETHYRHYFTDRSSIVALSERYEGIFTTLKNKAKTLSQQLLTQNQALEQLADRVKQEGNMVESDRSSLQSEIAANPSSDYSARISAFNDRVRNYNQIVIQLKEQTASYNQLVTERNSINQEEKSLFESLENKSARQVAK
ncbi:MULTISPECIES: hypothetical protein [unclassified Chamaesiphon]|uniref:hypothetical protein n=1 Tax=unclassified Chamaesiphon TaxID=2620921 RepID=UPI00286AE308|nr:MULTISPECIES: hypothetical protein [unclassified Chamaesiphon]